MKRNVKITVHGKDSAYTVRGSWEPSAEGWLLVYDEPESAEMGAVRTTLALSEGSALLTRRGAVHSEFRFDERTAHSSVYETPYGSFPTELVTHALHSKLSENGGLIDIRYTLTIGGAADEYRLKLLVRTEEET